MQHRVLYPAVPGITTWEKQSWDLSKTRFWLEACEGGDVELSEQWHSDWTVNCYQPDEPFKGSGPTNELTDIHMSRHILPHSLQQKNSTHWCFPPQLLLLSVTLVYPDLPPVRRISAVSHSLLMKKNKAISNGHNRVNFILGPSNTSNL